MVLLYHFWQYRAYFSVRYCLRYIVCGKFEDFNIKKYSDSNHLNNRLKKYLTGGFAELSVDSINDKMTDEYDCSTVGKED